MTVRTGKQRQHNEKKQLVDQLGRLLPADIAPHEVTFVCIGTDRSIGDSLGPIVGSMLMAQGYPRVIGDASAPLDADTIAARLANLTGAEFVIAIDASVGARDAIGTIALRAGGLLPGSGVNRSSELPEVGHISVTACVGRASTRQNWLTPGTPYSEVRRLAKQIVSVIEEAMPLQRRYLGCIPPRPTEGT